MLELLFEMLQNSHYMNIYFHLITSPLISFTCIHSNSKWNYNILSLIANVMSKKKEYNMSAYNNILLIKCFYILFSHRADQSIFSYKNAVLIFYSTFFQLHLINHFSIIYTFFSHAQYIKIVIWYGLLLLLAIECRLSPEALSNLYACDFKLCENISWQSFFNYFPKYCKNQMEIYA